MAEKPNIPSIDVRSLFDARSRLRDRTDQALMQAAEQVGFVQLSGLDGLIDITAARRTQLKRIFGLSPAELQPLWRQKFTPEHANIYRGWFPLQPGNTTLKEGIDMGPDVVQQRPAAGSGDPLLEATPLPPESLLPGWQGIVARHYRDMTGLGAVLMRCIARGLGLDQQFFDAAFEGGISTLRLIRYPDRTDGHGGLVGAPHVDSGLVTLLLQDGVSGLQVRTQAGDFIDVPAQEQALVVNFGRLLELWSDGRIRATEHQVRGSARERYSFPFFYEPRVDTRIAPLFAAARRFEPFLYGDFVWRAATRFVEFDGLQNRRPGRGSIETIEQLIA